MTSSAIEADIFSEEGATCTKQYLSGTVALTRRFPGVESRRPRRASVPGLKACGGDVALIFTRGWRASEVFEGEFNEFQLWLKRKGLKKASITSYRSRARRFAHWYELKKGRPFEASLINPDDAEQFVAELRDSGLSEKQARITGVAGWLSCYTRWSLETGRLERDPFKSRVDGLDDFCRWLKNRNRPSTINLHRNNLYAFAQWYNEEKREVLTPKAATPENLDEFLSYADAIGRYESESRLRRCSVTVRFFARWAEETGQIAEDPFTVIRWSDKDEFADWLRDSGKTKWTTICYAGVGYPRFAEWYKQARGRKLGKETVTPDDVEEFGRSLRARSDISRRQYYQWIIAARTFIAWAQETRIS